MLTKLFIYMFICMHYAIYKTRRLLSTDNGVWNIWKPANCHFLTLLMWFTFWHLWVILRNGAHIQLTEHRGIHMDDSCMCINLEWQMMHHNAQFYFRNLTGPDTFFFKYCVMSTCTHFKPCINTNVKAFDLKPDLKLDFQNLEYFLPLG